MTGTTGTSFASAENTIAWDAGEHVVERQLAFQVLTSLSERDIEALTLVTWHGLDASEAAAVAGCSSRAFTIRLHRARRRLAEALRSADQGRKPFARLPGEHGVRPPTFLPPATAHQMEQR